MKSFLLLFTTLVSCLLIHTGLRLYGYTFSYAERRSPILPQHKLSVWEPNLSSENYDTFLETIKKECKEDCLVSLKTYYTKDKRFVLYDNSDNRFRHVNGAENLSLSELQAKAGKELLLLENFLKSYPKAKGLIHIEANTPGVLKSLNPLVKEDSSYKRFILCSHFGNIVRSIREENPHWNTCASKDEKTKAHMLSAIYLESIAPLPTEYFYFSEEEKGRYTDRLQDEILRRTLFVIEPAENI